MPSTSRQDVPSSWASYERGGRAGSTDSRTSVQFDEESQRHHDSVSSAGHLHPQDGEGRRTSSYNNHHGSHSLRRRSSFADRVRSLRDVGGANSIDNFARSWQRAAGFVEVVPVRQSFRYADDEGETEEEYGREAITPSPVTQRGLLRQQLEAHEGVPPETVLEEEDEDTDGEEDPTTPMPMKRNLSAVGAAAAAGIHHQIQQERTPLLRSKDSGPARRASESIFQIEPSLASPFGGSYGTTWGSLSSRVNEPAMRHAGRLFRQQQAQGTSEPDKEREPILVKQVQDEDSGKLVNVVVGQSTLPQTIFNSVNVLVGVGLLALPLSMKYAGWLPGLAFLAFAALSTAYTARLLAKCADVDNSLITFADLAYVSFGHAARILTSILFLLELIAACLALVIIFADTMDALIPGLGNTEWKIACGVILVPLSFVPLRLLSFTSILGIMACLSIVSAIFIDGLIKPHQPGSLREPATTYLFPANWLTLPISFGLLMSLFGGHSVMPNIYRDMRHPYKFRKAVTYAWTYTFLIDLGMAIVGWLMFGDGVRDEITKNIVVAHGYPEWLTYIVAVCIAIIPITKVPLNSRPIVSTVEIALGLDSRVVAESQALTGLSGATRGVLKITVRITTIVVFVVLAILVPDFDRIMSLMGTVACFTICIILPCAFHLKLFGKELSKAQKALDWALIVVSTAMALVGTAFNFVPREKLGA